MNDDPDVHFIGAISYFAEAPAGHPDLVRHSLRAVLADLALTEKDIKLAQYFLGGDQRGWRAFAWERVDESLTNTEVGALDILYGTPRHVRMTMNAKLRTSPALSPPRVPWSVSFISEATPETAPRIIAAGRHLLDIAAASAAAPISGAVFRAPAFNEGHHEIDGGHDIGHLPKWFQDRHGHDQWHRSKLKTLAKRLYPITLLGPALAAQTSAAALRAAGAAAVTPVNGSLIVDAPGDVVETWDAGFLARTVELRRLLWPLTIKNPADAGGLD